MKVKLGVGVALGISVGFVALHTARGFRNSSLVERELVELGRDGLLELPMSSRGESAEVTEGRRDLDTLLAWITERQYTGELLFNRPSFVERTDDLERVRVELEARRIFFDGLDRLPTELWGSPGAPATAGVARLMKLRAAANALGVRAWMAGRCSDGGAEAGRHLARALEIARVRDDGRCISLIIRWAVVEVVVMEAQVLLAERVVERDELLAPLEGELRLATGDERFELMFAADLLALHDYEASLRRLQFTPGLWWSRPGVMGERLRLLGDYRDLMSGDARAKLLSRPEWDASPRAVRLLGEEDTWLAWPGLVVTDTRVRRDVAALLGPG